MVENETIKERLGEYLKAKKITPTAFEKNIKAGGSYLNNVKSIGSDKLLAISRAYKDINLEWLITGEGDMLKSEDTIIKDVGHSIAGNDSSIAGDININVCKSELERLKLKVTYLERMLKDKEDIIDLLKKFNKQENTV
jgi:hypothetical protein